MCSATGRGTTRDPKDFYATPNDAVEPLLYTRIEHDEAQIQRLHNDRTHLKRKCSAIKGVATRIKRRVSAGVCPCCNRTFQCLARHMATKHPDYQQEAV